MSHIGHFIGRWNSKKDVIGYFFLFKIESFKTKKKKEKCIVSGTPPQGFIEKYVELKIL